MYRLTKKIQVIFHNFKGYDSHLIMKEIGKFKKDINVIRNNMDLVFIESLQFLNKSLSNLVNNSPNYCFIYTKNSFPDSAEGLDHNGEQTKIDLVKGKRKSVMTIRFNEMCLPSKETFDSILTDEGISDNDYKHAQNVWENL